MAIITHDVLEALLCVSADRRQAAECFLKSLTVEQRCQGFLEILQQQQGGNGCQNQSQQMSAVLLRRDILLLSESRQLSALVDPLCSIFAQAEHSNKRFIGDCLAEVISSLQWIDFPTSVSTLQSISNVIGASASQGDTDSIRLLTRIAERAANTFANVVLPVVASLTSSAFASVQNDPAKVVLLLQLVVAAAAASSETSSLDSSCVLPLLNYFEQQERHGAWVSSGTESLLLAAETSPSLLSRNHDVFSGTLKFCLQAIRGSSEEYYCQLNAVQVISTLTAVDTVKRTLSRNLELRSILLDTSHDSILGVCVRIICMSVDDDLEAWASEPVSLNEDGMGWEGDSDCSYAELLLTQMIANLGASSLKVILQAIEPFLQSTTSHDWKAQRAAISILQCCADAAPTSFAPFVNTALEATMMFVSSQNVRVQYQALMFLGILCDTAEYEAVVRNLGAARLLQSFAYSSHSPCTKVSAMACMGIVSYCRPAGKEIEDAEKWLIPYVSDVLTALISGPLSLQLNSSGAAVVKARAIGALACLAESSGDYFAQFYPSVVPGLLECAQLTTGGNREMEYLTGAALETVTIIGQSINGSDPNLFFHDARKILQWAMRILSQGETRSANAPTDQVLAACARIASVMGEEYVPYADTVLGYLVQRATDPDDVDFTEGSLHDLDNAGKFRSAADEDDGAESMTIAVPGQGLTKVTVNTTKIEDKVQAARAVYEHAVALRNCFGPYSTQCLEAFLPLAHFKFSPVLRAAASQTLAAVFDAACHSNDSDVPNTYLPVIAKTISTQLEDEEAEDMETMHALADSLCDVFRTLFFLEHDYRQRVFCDFSLEDANSLVQVCIKSVVACLERRRQILTLLIEANRVLDSEDDVKQHQSRLEIEQDFLTPLVDTVGYVLKLFKNQFIPTFESMVAPALGPHLNNGIDTRARVSAVCLFDDIVEHCGSEAAAKFSPLLIEGAILGLDTSTNGNDADLQSASIYGITQIARYAPSGVLVPHIQSIISQLSLLASGPKDMAENLVIYENAVSCLASLVLFRNSPFQNAGLIKRDTLIRTFLNGLPLREDQDEAKLCHADLCSLVEQGLVDVVAEGGNIVRIIGETLAFVEDGEDIADPDTCAHLADILIHLQQTDCSGCIRESFDSLSVEGQAAINVVLEQHAHRRRNIITP